jgi:hypothetical protein
MGQQSLETETRVRSWISGSVEVRNRESRLARPAAVERIRNGDLDQWEVAVKPAGETCRTPLAFPVEPEATWEVVDMDPRMLDGSFLFETDTRRRSWVPGSVDVRYREGKGSRLAGPTAMDRIRNGDLDQWEGMCNLNGSFLHPGEHYNTVMWYIRPSEKQVGLALGSGQLHPGAVQRYFTMRVSSNVYRVRGSY